MTQKAAIRFSLCQFRQDFPLSFRRAPVLVGRDDFFTFADA